MLNNTVRIKNERRVRRLTLFVDELSILIAFFSAILLRFKAIMQWADLNYGIYVSMLITTVIFEVLIYYIYDYRVNTILLMDPIDNFTQVVKSRIFLGVLALSYLFVTQRSVLASRMVIALFLMFSALIGYLFRMILRYRYLKRYGNPADTKIYEIRTASPDIEAIKEEIDAGDGLLRLGDKVMQTKNNYQQEWSQEIEGKTLKRTGTGIFNGDMGTITEISREMGTVTVRFEDGRTAVYQPGNRSELDLAYAITIHKSQGSEYPAIVMPLLSGPEMLMNRNLFYTGITRAKKCVMLIGKRATIEQMIGNTHEQVRYTSLTDRINESCGDMAGEGADE